MDLDERYQTLMSEITKQEEFIENYASKLEEAGNIDPSIEDYLNNTREELRQRKQRLIDEFAHKSTTKSLHRTIEIQEPDSPKVKVKCNTPNSFSSRIKQFPFYSVHDIEVEKSPALPKDIFKKPSSTASHTNSPSTTRYSPKKQQPTKSPFQGSSSLKKEFLSTENSSGFGSGEEYRDDADSNFSKYQGMRELRNIAHEQMLLYKEKMLEKREKELAAMMRYIESKSIRLSRGGFYDSTLEDQEEEESLGFSERFYESPRREKKESKKNREGNKIGDLLASISGLPKTKISHFQKLCSNKPPRKTRKDVFSRD